MAEIVIMLHVICHSVQFAKCATHCKFLTKPDHKPNPTADRDSNLDPSANLTLIVTVTKLCSTFCKLQRV